MDRSQVYSIINGERNYQDGGSSNWDHNGVPSVEAELLLLEEYILEARKAWRTNTGNTQALDMMRKLVAIGIRCFENHGDPSIIKMNRDRIYKIIDGVRDCQERDHQPSRKHHAPPSVEAELLSIEEYFLEARKAWRTKVGYAEAYDMIGKLVATGVRCFENHGVPARISPQTNGNEEGQEGKKN